MSGGEWDEGEAFSNLRCRWMEADKTATDYRSPDEVKALAAMLDVSDELRRLGWRDIIYCPKDGERFLAIEFGSCGAFPCYYEGKWPGGSWWTEAHGDLWPSHPIMWRPLEKRGGA